MTYLLGLNAFHGDASAALIRDGVLVAAVEEERIRRIKHWAGFPSESIRACLKIAGITLAEVDHIAINHDGRANLAKKITHVLTTRPEFSVLLDRLKNQKQKRSIAENLDEHFPGHGFRGRTHQVEHHLAHLASAYYCSGFPEALAVSIDGFGDFASTAWGYGEGNALTLDDKIYFPHSLGIFYQAMTQYLGFPNYGDEYKVMGLAPYGQPSYGDHLGNLLTIRPDGQFRLNLDFFRHHRERITFEWENGEPRFDSLYSSELVNLLGPARRPDQPVEQHHKDLARTTQALFEKAAFALINAQLQRRPSSHLVLAGGCAMNSVANGKLYANTSAKRVYVQAAAGDAGGAIGAALSVWHGELGQSTGGEMSHAYWGPEYTEAEFAALLTDHTQALAAAGVAVSREARPEDLLTRVAGRIADGKVIGWFQGRMEWGPRALGNRSILCDPRRADMKDILNAKIKRRESFRPFAPSVLREAVDEWFETEDDVPFMMQVFQIREAKRAQIPAVTHVDGSGRLQTVTAAGNARYYELIRKFFALTGVPMLLNTSFNENEPIVCRPEEALDCFLRTRMDTLVLGDYVLERG